MKEKHKDIFGSVAFWLVVVGVSIIWIIVIRNQVIRARNCKSLVKIIDRETVSTAERLPVKVYIRTEHRYFPPGRILTSKENEALILWDSTMPETWIVGVVSDSGTIEHYKPK